MSWMTASPQFTRSHRVGIHDTVKSYECVAIKFFFRSSILESLRPNM